MSVWDWFRGGRASPPSSYPGQMGWNPTAGGPMGWINDPTRYNLIGKSLPVFDSRLVLQHGEPNVPILLYMAWQLALGGFPAYGAQKTGDCVSQGWGRANDLVQCDEILQGEQTVYQETCTEYVYATSRKIGGLLGNRSAGSFGSAAALAVMRWGHLSRVQANAQTYDARRADEWGYSGAPPELMEIGKGFTIPTVARVTNRAMLISALWNRKPVIVCSNQAFSMERDRDGFCAPDDRTQWPHCMHIVGVRFDRPGACIAQSWGANVPSGPTSLGQPDFSFWADLDVVCNRMLPLGDSYCPFSAPDFKPKSLPSYYTRAA